MKTAVQPKDKSMDTNDTDATHLLAADHRKVENLFEQFEQAGNGRKKMQIAREICTELKIHTILEEEIFYPALRGKIEDEVLDEALVEHDAAKTLVNAIEASGDDEAFFEAKITVLKEEIEHHVKEEEKERDNMFQQARATDVDLDALGQQMQARKEELMAQAQAGELPPAQPSTM
jgi:hemerythrin superfamily protein